jgi:hypothetical protein
MKEYPLPISTRIRPHFCLPFKKKRLFKKKDIIVVGLIELIIDLFIGTIFV